MEKVQIELHVGSEEFIPVYASEAASGADLKADVSEPLVIEPGATVAVPTGVRMEIPPGYEAQVRPRSGLAAKNGITVLNTPGTIDSDYRGEILVLLINHSAVPFTVKRGDRIAQIVFAPVTRACFSFTDKLSETGRGTGGFGSTGI